jgi:predicted DNA-binding ribbon-helix-helix protein
VTKDLKRSLTIALEAEFWDALGKMAKSEGKSVSAMVGEIDQSRGDRNLSSAIRVKILKGLQVKLS